MVNCKKKSLLLTMTAFSMILPSIQVSHASESSSILINEVESSDASGGNDRVEIINISDTDIDISGWYITDDKGKERVDESSTYPLIENTTLKAGEVLVLEETVNFDFGLGTGDTVTLYNANGEQVDTYSWSGHAAGTYSRTSTGEFVD